MTKAERDAKRQASLRAHASRIKRQYGITGEQYWALYEAQGGKCAICRHATGAAKRLAVDHDHHNGCTHPPVRGCPDCVRGLLCGPCNKLLGHIRDNPSRLVEYIGNPPFQKFRRSQVEAA